LGLVRVVRRGIVTRDSGRAYAVTLSMENPHTENPMQARYPSTYWKVRPYEINKALRVNIVDRDKFEFVIRVTVEGRWTFLMKSQRSLETM